MTVQVVGGAAYFNRLVNGVYDGELKLRSTQGFALAISEETLKSYNNDDTGLGVVEAEEKISQEMSGTMPARDVTLELLAMMFGAASVTSRSQAAGSLSETLVGVKPGRYYQLGVGASFPTGARKLSAETVQVAAAAKTGYTLDANLGRLYIVPGGDIALGDDVDVAASLAQADWESVVSAGSAAIGELRVIGQSSQGVPRDYYFPNATLSLNGDFSVKGDPENAAFQQLPIQVTVAADTLRGLAPVYIDGRPAA